MNKQLLALLADVAWATLNADKEFVAFQSAHDEIVEKLQGKLDDDALGILENSLNEGANMMLNIVLPLALEMGRNPAKLLDLPETNGASMFVGKK